MSHIPPPNQISSLQSHDGAVGRRRMGLGNNSRRTKTNPDQAVRETDTDASVARFSAVSKGYIHDEFAGLFVPPNQNSIRPPWVNIGTHHRTYVIDALVERFIRLGEGPKQVLSLGCGSDSRYWRLLKCGGEQWPVVRWVETDFKESVKVKIDTIMRHDQLRSGCGGEIKVLTEEDTTSSGGSIGTREPTELHGQRYSLISADLRESGQLVRKLSSGHTSAGPLLRADVATLVIAELVFVYMLPEQTESCLRELNTFFGGELMVITYEALNLGDNFSKMMVQNLAARGLTLLGLNHNASLDSQIKRFRDLDFTQILSTDMKRLRDATGDDEEWQTRWRGELERIKRLEFLDEVEELELVLEHYALTWAIKGGTFHGTGGAKKDSFCLPRLA